MDQTGLLNKIFAAAQYIDWGRKGVATDGSEREGRIYFETGITEALSAFKKTQATANSQLLILTELSFLQQELEYCNEADTAAQSSLTQAIQSFDDALRCIETVKDSVLYRAVETAFPTSSKYRIKDFPRDAVHIACTAHWTRLQNILRAPGISMPEKAVLEQRAANMKTIQAAHLEKQTAALSG
jgi:hypothetical protein